MMAGHTTHSQASAPGDTLKIEVGRHSGWPTIWGRATYGMVLVSLVRRLWPAAVSTLMLLWQYAAMTANIVGTLHPRAVLDDWCQISYMVLARLLDSLSERP